MSIAARLSRKSQEEPLGFDRDPSDVLSRGVISALSRLRPQNINYITVAPMSIERLPLSAKSANRR
jgi:hypothetical protein